MLKKIFYYNNINYNFSNIVFNSNMRIQTYFKMKPIQHTEIIFIYILEK